MMKSIHQFDLQLDWDINCPSIGNNGRTYIKSHKIFIENKPELDVSAAKIFKGDPNLYNPEDLLLSSLASCHMMSYLYCCEQNQIEITHYQDNAEAFLEVNADGSGKINKVVLKPQVIITNASQIQLAKELHQKANELCFIANSCNFPVEHYPTIIIKK